MKSNIVMLLLAVSMWVSVFCINDVILRPVLIYASLIVSLVVFIVCGADFVDRLLKCAEKIIKKGE